MALQQTATQSSTASGVSNAVCCGGGGCTYYYVPYSASIAVAGTYTCTSSSSYTPNSCGAGGGRDSVVYLDSNSQSATSNQLQPWWEVDLGFVTSVGSVVITSTSLLNAVVFVNSFPGLQWTQLPPTCFQTNSGSASSSVISISQGSARLDCNSAVGRYITIGINSTATLSLCAVEVYFPVSKPTFSSIAVAPPCYGGYAYNSTLCVCYAGWAGTFCNVSSTVLNIASSNGSAVSSSVSSHQYCIYSRNDNYCAPNSCGCQQYQALPASNAISGNAPYNCFSYGTSSVYNGYTSTTTNAFLNAVFSSNVELAPWWMVDLGGTYSIGEIHIWAPPVSFRLILSLDSSLPLSSWQNCQAGILSSSSVTVPPTPSVFNCNGTATAARFVAITTPAPNVTTALTLCQVEVYATRAPSAVG